MQPRACPGLYNGAVLPPTFYVPASGPAANRSLTLVNVSINYDTCAAHVWHPVSSAIASQLQVSARSWPAQIAVHALIGTL